MPEAEVAKVFTPSLTPVTFREPHQPHNTHVLVVPSSSPSRLRSGGGRLRQRQIALSPGREVSEGVSGCGCEAGECVRVCVCMRVCVREVSIR